MGEYRRARGSLHVRGAFWLRSQVPIRRAKGPSFTRDEEMYVHDCYYIDQSVLVSMSLCLLVCPYVR